ncbi:hypothetical protein GCM10027275_22430 [Rhabdobacter roseus]|uniref:Uncharacterized protein n=1 Tax=Rhabdobacter roseus TaxID=1655419 RepID=A0A840TVM5_9BACT|nr:hypothetical protein [Rhabdobacter roseus]MBB5284178.1 hypothetical protein [Rhabdobacter roseus]
MEDKEILALWKSYDQKLEQALVLHQKNAEDMTQIKVQSLLASMKPLKLFTLAVGVLWVAFVDIILINIFPAANLFFLISAGIQVLLTKLALGVYLYQSLLIQRVTITDPIVTTQKRIAQLTTSTLWVTRLLFLQLPVWTTFYLNKGMFQEGNSTFYFIQALATVSCTYLALWLFFHIKYENRNQKWFRLIFEGKEWTPVMKAMDLLEQIKNYNNEEARPTS